MRTKSFFQILFLLLLLLSKDTFCQGKISYGIKGGIGIWQVISMKDDPGIGHDPIYSYPPGFSIGVFTETRLSEKFFLVNELTYQKRITRLTISTGYEGIVEQEITTKFINLPILLKYQTSWLWDSFFILGPEFGYLLKANYNHYDRIYKDRGDIEITKDLPKISTSINFGVGEQFNVQNLTLITELRTQLGISRFKYIYEIGNWRNLGLTFLISVRL